MRKLPLVCPVERARIQKLLGYGTGWGLLGPATLNWPATKQRGEEGKRQKLSGLEGKMIHGTISREEAVLAFIGAAPGSMLAHDAERIVAAINALPAVQPAPDVGALVEAAQGMKRIIEGVEGAMNYGTWRSERTNLRIKDTQEWVALYNALAQWEAGK
jgi:hypothetical protein